MKSSKALTDKPDNSGRGQDGRWQKGVSGNPSGPPPGYRHKATRAAQDLLDGQAEAITQQAVDMALGGDTVALRLCLERLVSPRKEAPVAITLPALSSATDAAQVLAALVAGVAAGELLPAEAKAVGGLVDLFTKAAEIEALAERLAAIEQELRARS